MIALALKTLGQDGYIRVQVLAGLMYAASFLSSKRHSSLLESCSVVSVLTCSLVWLLRSWKLHQLDSLGLVSDGKEGAGSQSSNELGRKDHDTLRFRPDLRTYVGGMFRIRHI